jgi:hypothetical protein
MTNIGNWVVGALNVTESKMTGKAAHWIEVALWFGSVQIAFVMFLAIFGERLGVKPAIGSIMAYVSGTEVLLVVPFVQFLKWMSSKEGTLRQNKVGANQNRGRGEANL